GPFAFLPLPSGERVGVRGRCSRRTRFPLSRLRERGRGEGLLLSCISQAIKRFRAPAGARATFLLRGQEKSSQKRRPPRGVAFRPSMAGKSVSRGRAFRAGSCPREKASPSVGSPAARPDRPRLTAAEGPRKSGRASC